MYPQRRSQEIPITLRGEELLPRSFPAVLRTPIVPRVIRFTEDMLEKDLRDNRNIGDLGARHLLEHTNPRGGKVTVLTHCNTGALATAGYGTALGEAAPSIVRAWEGLFGVQGKAP